MPELRQKRKFALFQKNEDMSEEQNKEYMPKPGEVYEIPEEGSLGLLALGAVGLKAWRQKKREVQQEKAQNEEKNNEKSEE